MRYKYGVRGRALDPEIGVPAGGIPDRTDVPLDRLLQDMYVFLLKECNIVLNGLFASTLIEKDKREIETGARIDDEEETPAQAFQRLGDLSADAEADCRHTAAEQFHLERIQMSAYNPAIGIDNDKVYASYALYAEFLLRRAAKLRVLATTPESVSVANGYVQIAREALEQAVSRSGRRRYWRYELLLGCLLYDQGLEEAGDACMDRALSSQLGDVAVSISDLGGYDSDGMVKADPLLYAVLAGQYSRGLQPIKSRKALRLLSRSYAEGGFEPAVAHHGSPRRTATLCLARAAEYLFGFGFVELGKACLTLARECDRAATERALEFGVSPAAPVFIRYAIQRAEAAELLSERELDAAVRAMEESVLISEEDDDKVRSLLWVAGVNADYPLDDHAAAIDSYIRAIHTGEEKPYLIPLDALVRLGKLLIEGARYTEALEFLLFGCRLYAFSSTLFKLVGLTSLRLGKLEDAEDALYEANLLDNRSPEVWGYLCLLCLTCGAHREKEAELSLVQALRLGLDSNSLLRELAVAYMAADKLQVAEDLVRRATVCDRFL